MSPRLPSTSPTLAPSPHLTSGTKRSAAGTLKKGAALAAACERGMEADKTEGEDVLRKALSSDEFVKRTQAGSPPPSSSAASGVRDGKRRQVVSPSSAIATLPNASGGVLHPRVPRSQPSGGASGTSSSGTATGGAGGLRSKSRSARSSPRLHASPRLAAPPHQPPRHSLSLPPSPVLGDSTSASSRSTPSPTSVNTASASPPHALCGACPAPRGSTIAAPLRPDEPAVTGVAVLAGGELLSVDVDDIPSTIPAEWTLPSPLASPRLHASAGAPARLAPGGRDGGGVRRCVSASPPTTSNFPSPALLPTPRPLLPRAGENAPSGLTPRTRGSSSTSLASAAPSKTSHTHRRRRRTRGGSSSVSSSAVHTPLSSSPVAADRPPLQTYTSFEEHFGLSAPPSPPPSPPPVKEEGGGARWWHIG
ncbi:hypothetical protein JCM11251_000802 [Rhodosporidiobolus azoricus]